MGRVADATHFLAVLVLMWMRMIILERSSETRLLDVVEAFGSELRKPGNGWE